jgi:hypothetical protein
LPRHVLLAFPINPSAVLRSTRTALFSWRVSDVALVGGGLYLTVMRAMLAGFQRMGCVLPDARVTTINGPIGPACGRICADGC